ncbi:hypothetical protein M5E06_35375 [Azospirillum sp. A1-3]|uniref:hypothetical protein n=1 Tax=Azospirillum sp. A1-3 TaxID=185874 RepID=UPI0020772759|nr:hypothetical protein [Azospirillum sp. A1-3]MCM8739359.1 hypothetical protein [Azospirillum sp. A1-3]
MSKKTLLPLDDDDDDVLAQRIAETATQRGIPSLTPMPVALSTAHVGARRPIKIEVSDPLFEALTVAAARQKVTKRYLILSALRDAGYPVEDTDFQEDGRRLRGSRKS